MQIKYPGGTENYGESAGGSWAGGSPTKWRARIGERHNFPFGKQVYIRHKDSHTLWLDNPISKNLDPQHLI